MIRPPARHAAHGALLRARVHRPPLFHSLFLLLLGAALVGGCASVTAPPAPASLPAAVAARPYHQSIAIDGRLSVRYQQDGRDQALHGGFEWRQSPGRVAIALRSPLGQTLATIAVTPDEATLVRAGEPPRRAADADALAASALGWPLPVAGLRDWLQGFATAADGRRFVALPDQASSVVTRAGGRLTYDDWRQDDPAAPPHPHRLDASRSTEQAGEVALRIVIDRWQPL
ncbi:MAG: outer membrane lipoprotein LolB [Burkholderiaceae bacterium]